MNVVIVAVILIVFLFWEIALLIALIFSSRERGRARVLAYEDKALDLIFLLFRAYRGFKVRFENLLEEALPPRFLIVANHQSLLDIPILMRLVPQGMKARFVAKRELAWGIPLISLQLRMAGHSLVRRRGDPLRAVRAVTQMAKRCKAEGSIPVIFPEGTRAKEGVLGSFHSAGYRKILEVEALPLLVVAIDGGWRVSKLKDFFRDFGKTDYSLRFLALLSAPLNKKEALARLEESRELIEASLSATRGAKSPGGKAGV